jgi:small subunit ribosomal protein S20
VSELYGRTVTLANTKSAMKRIRVAAARNERNQSYRARVRTFVKKAEQTIASGTADAAVIQQAISTLDKAAVKGVIHKNNAARKKSRLMKKANAVVTK